MKSTTNRLSFFHSLFVCLFKWKQKETKRKSIEFDFQFNPSIHPFLPINSIQFNWLKVKRKAKERKAIENSNKQTLISVFGAFEEIWLIDWWLSDDESWLIDWEKEEKINKKRTKLSNLPFSQNKQTNKRGGKRQFNQTHPKDKSQSKTTEPNRSETKRKRNCLKANK